MGRPESVAMAPAARLVVAAWALAADGDDTRLTAMAQCDAAHWLLHPALEHGQVAPGPRTTRIKISRLDLTPSRRALQNSGAPQGAADY